MRTKHQQNNVKELSEHIQNTSYQLLAPEAQSEIDCSPVRTANISSQFSENPRSEIMNAVFVDFNFNACNHACTAELVDFQNIPYDLKSSSAYSKCCWQISNTHMHHIVLLRKIDHLLLYQAAQQPTQTFSNITVLNGYKKWRENKLFAVKSQVTSTLSTNLSRRNTAFFLKSASQHQKTKRYF